MPQLILPSWYDNQPQGQVEIADEFADAYLVWLPHNPTVDLSNRGNPLTKSGTLNRVVGPNGISQVSPDWTSANWINGPVVNPYTLNWPGITVISVVRFLHDAVPTTGAPAATIGAADEGYQGFWSILFEQDNSTVRSISWRPGNNTGYLSPTGVNTVGNTFTETQDVVVVGTWDKVTSRLVGAGSKYGLFNQSYNTPTNDWVNTPTTVRVGGYSRSGNRPNKNPVYMVAVLPYAVNEEKAKDLVNNPWQLFRAEPDIIYFSTGGGTTTIAADIAQASATGATANVANNITITCYVAQASATGLDAEVNTSGSSTISCSLGSAGAAGIAAAIDASTQIAALLGIGEASGHTANLTLRINASVADGTATGHTAIIVADNTIVCITGVANAAGLSATVANEAIGTVTLTPEDIAAIASAVLLAMHGEIFNANVLTVRDHPVPSGISTLL